MMRWFGPDERAPFQNHDLERVEAPIGSPCEWCGEIIEATDYGNTMTALLSDGAVAELPYHYECQARKLLGSLAHLQGRCSCGIPGSTCTDPPEMTLRESAKAALREFQVFGFSRVRWRS